MLKAGRIPMTETEAVGVQALFDKQGIDDAAYLQKSISICRNDPGEQGAIRVEIDGDAWLVDKTGEGEEGVTVQPRPRSRGLVFVHPDGRVERFRDNHDGTYTDDQGRRVENPTGAEGVRIFVVPEFVDERGV